MAWFSSRFPPAVVSHQPILQRRPTQVNLGKAVPLGLRLLADAAYDTLRARQHILTGSQCRFPLRCHWGSHLVSATCPTCLSVEPAASAALGSCCSGLCGSRARRRNPRSSSSHATVIRPPFYSSTQMANRLADLSGCERWLGSCRLVHLLFVGDPHGPTTREQWTTATEAANGELGFAGAAVPHVGHVLLDARDRSEIL